MPTAGSGAGDLATPGDLTALGWDGLPSETVAQRWLDVVWRALRREDGMSDLDARLASGELDPADVSDVICQATLRVLRNPEGLSQSSTSIDDYSESGQVADATRDVFFTAAELRRVAAPDQPAVTAGSLAYS